MPRRPFAVVGLFVLLSVPLSAREVWIVQFDVPFSDSVACRSAVAWRSRFVAHNTTEQPLSIGYGGVSNGAARADAESLAIGPHRTLILLGDLSGSPNWRPDVVAPRLWVVKLDIPDGVRVSDRVESQIRNPVETSSPECAFNLFYSAGLPLRVFEKLVPARMPSTISESTSAPFFRAARARAPCPSTRGSTWASTTPRPR